MCRLKSALMHSTVTFKLHNSEKHKSIICRCLGLKDTLRPASHLTFSKPLVLKPLLLLQPRQQEQQGSSSETHRDSAGCQIPGGDSTLQYISPFTHQPTRYPFIGFKNLQSTVLHFYCFIPKGTGYRGKEKRSSSNTF